MENDFIKAFPIWETGKESEMNLRLQFKAVVGKLKNSFIKIATSGMYQLWINGEFVCYGPARAGKGHFRMDQINIQDKLYRDNNVIIIEVVGYNVNSYAIQNQDSFLQAEIVDGSEVVAFTGKDFTARKNPYYYQKTPRYSFQRPMLESYHYDNPQDEYFTNEKIFGNVKLSNTCDKKIISRFVEYPEYKKLSAKRLGVGNFDFSKDEKPWRDRPLTHIGPELLGFDMNELDVFPSEECTGLNCYQMKNALSNALHSNQYTVYKLPFLATGFLTLEINCHSDSQIYVLFDEIAKDDGTVNHIRCECANVFRLDLSKGNHNIQLFEVYAMQYIQILVVSGECEIKNIGMTEYKHSPVNIPKMKSNKLQKIAFAAAESFCQNAVDIFMDCPSRERAGWLCDSFFTARAEKYATGSSFVEKSFLENFLHEDNYEYLPEGMLPMCYPADHYDGAFIPQWAMWLVLQLGEYYERSKDLKIINEFQNKIEKLLHYFEKFENNDGLLENLDGWKFIEWSEANNLVDGVNYPTNMLYSAMLKTLGNLYSNVDYINKADKIKDKVIEQSFNGEFFTDNAIRKDGKLASTNKITEVCQYYAFFLEIATEKSHKKLFDTLINDFGPERKNEEKWKNIYPAVPFIGYFLRLEILSKYGKLRELAGNIEKYYYDMALKTGTLWEHADIRASCCHGFSGYILCWLDILSENGF